MLQRVDVGERSLSTFRGIVPDPILVQVRERARRLQGVCVLPGSGSVEQLLSYQPTAKTTCSVSKSGSRINPARSAVRMEGIFSALVRATTAHCGR
jgi:hypothetical protein